MKTMKINIINSFNEKDYSQVIELVLKKASNLTDNQNSNINIILVDNTEIKRLNKLKLTITTKLKMTLKLEIL